MELLIDYWHGPAGQWITALGLAIAINAVVALLKWVATRRLAALAERTTTSVDDSLVAVLNATRQSLVLFVSLFLASRQLDIPDRINVVIAATAGLAAFIQVGLWANALLEFWLVKYRARTLQANAGAATSIDMLGFVGKLALWSLVVLLALDNFGVDVTALVAGLGIGGIAVALAVQNILGDLFASLSIVVDKPFVLGDFIIVGEYMGTVEHVGLKTTRIRSLGGEQIVFSNGDLLKARLRNYKRMYQRRALFSFGVLYETPADKLEQIPEIVRGIVAAQPLTRFDRAHFVKFGESSLDFEVVYWILDADYNKYMDIQQQINLALVRELGQRGIGFAYPTRTLIIQRSSDLKEETA